MVTSGVSAICKAWGRVCQCKDDLTCCFVTGHTKETSPYSDVLLIIHDPRHCACLTLSMTTAL